MQYTSIVTGGVQKLMLGAGKDCTDMFNRYHSWVNCDQILSKCLVGYLIEEEQTIEEEEEEEEEEEKEDKNEAVEEKNASGVAKGGVNVADRKDYKIAETESEGKSYDRDEEDLLRRQAKMSLEMPCDD